jgi:hypothetical protein
VTRYLDRRTFTADAIKAMLAGVVITITEGCGGGPSNPTSPSGGGGAAGDVNGSVSANHGHVATVTRVQLSEGGAVSLDIRGSGDHSHTVGLSGAQVTQIASGGRVSVESTSEQAHTHTVIFN